LYDACIALTSVRVKPESADAYAVACHPRAQNGGRLGLPIKL